MSNPITREQLLDALDRIGAAAAANQQTLEIAVYGGSALMLASNFRLASEDVDIAAIGNPWPSWLASVVSTLARENIWPFDWLNEAVTFHLSPAASLEGDHLAVGSFPRAHPEPTLKVYVPTAEYMLALKLKAIRITDPANGPQETSDILNLARFLKLTTPDEALKVLQKFFPKTATDVAKQKFLLKHVWNQEAHDAPGYIERSR